MTPIGDVLHPDHVILRLASREPQGAIEEVLVKLEGDERVRNFASLRQAVHAQPATAVSENASGICIAHGRTDLVTSLVMAAGRSPEGVAYPGLRDPVRLFFVAGIPSAFTSEYLRIVGAIVRICRDKRQLRGLLTAKDAGRFIELLGLGEVKL